MVTVVAVARSGRREIEMHAVVVRVKTQSSSTEGIRKQLETKVVPIAREIQGFIAGYWLAPKDGERLGFTIVDTLQSAEAAIKQIRPSEGDVLVSAEVREVLAST
jgi:hypothetical protein